MSSDPFKLTGRDALITLPDFIKPDLVADDAFMAAIDVTPSRTVTFQGTDVAVPADAFHQAVAVLYADPATASEVKTTDGRPVEVRIHPDKADALRLEVNGRVFMTSGHYELAPSPEARLTGFDAAIRETGLPPALFARHRAVLAERILTSAEMQDLDADLALTPSAVARAIDATFETNTVGLSRLVPASQTYYERLIGQGAPESLEMMAKETVPELAKGLLEVDRREGTKALLLLAAHARVLSGVDWGVLDDDDRLALTDWAHASGDPIAQLGWIEIAAPAVTTQPALNAPLTKLVRALCDLDPATATDQTHLFFALFILVDGELSRSGILADWPPFRRRTAVIAQACLILRMAHGRVDVPDFFNWVLGRDGRQAYMQLHVDLRCEPRWAPSALSPAQWKAEFMGRLRNLAFGLDAGLDGDLRKILTGPDPSDVPAQIEFPFSFRPGPLEGSAAPAPSPLPAEYEALLDESLDVEVLTPRALAALINLQGLYAIPTDKADKAVALIKASGHRLISAEDPEQIGAVLGGLAVVASQSRKPELAQELRIMCRRRRQESRQPVDLTAELQLAFVAGAANFEMKPWANFIGEWASELAFTVEDRTSAQAMLADLETITTIAPALRETCGRAVAALDAFVRR